LFGLCNGFTVLTIATTKTKVQLLAKESYANYLSSIIAARSILVRIATLLGTGTCLLLSNFISLEMTLILFVMPIALSALPFLIDRNRKLSVLQMPAMQKIAE
jgi:hypothetical protein